MLRKATRLSSRSRFSAPAMRGQEMSVWRRRNKKKKIHKKMKTGFLSSIHSIESFSFGTDAKRF